MITAANFQARFQGHVPGLMGASGSYAVLCPLVEQPDGLHLLYEVRAASLQRQPGEVCFPGGRIEPGETPENCVLRETEEELSIPSKEVQLIGRTDFICSHRGFLLQPILGIVSCAGFAGLIPSPSEVGSVFTVPVSYLAGHPPAVHHYLLQPEVPADFPFAEIGFPDGYPFRGGRVEEPIWHYNGHVIWGLTARITNHLIQRIKED